VSARCRAHARAADAAASTPPPLIACRRCRTATPLADATPRVYAAVMLYSRGAAPAALLPARSALYVPSLPDRRSPTVAERRHAISPRAVMPPPCAIDARCRQPAPIPSPRRLAAAMLPLRLPAAPAPMRRAAISRLIAFACRRARHLRARLFAACVFLHAAAAVWRYARRR